MNATAHTTHRAKCIEFPGFQFRSHFATLLSGNVQAVRRGGKEFYEIPIALAGRWVKGGREFSITSDDLAAMARNFEKRKNDQIKPEVIRGILYLMLAVINNLRAAPLVETETNKG